MCKVEGCDRKSDYKTADVCQKHYFRMMRNGTYDLIQTRKKIITRAPYRNCTDGYVLEYCAGHKLAHSNGYVYQHRKVMYDDFGENIPPCEWCGKPSSWNSRGTHIDHIDKNRSNNARSNLRVLCNSCNVSRTIKSHHSYSHCSAIEW